MPDRTCSVDGCEGSPRGQSFCGMHYARWRRTGDPGPPGKKNLPAPAECTVEGCRAVPKAKGLCELHWNRWYRHGDPEAHPFSPRGSHQCQVPGCDRPYAAKGYCSRHYWMQWKHGEPEPGGYAFAHNKVYRLRGRATGYPCEHCGRPAKHWAYDHQDPDERFHPAGRPYSVDPWHYLALCVSCHKILDSGERV